MLLSKTYFISFFILFFIIYGITISVGGIIIHSIQLLLLSFVMIFIMRLLKIKKIDLITIKYLLYVFPYVLYVLIYSTFLAQYRDSNIFIGLILFILALISSIHVSKYYFSKLGEEKILKIIFDATTIFSTIILVMVILEPFKDFVYSFTLVNEVFIETSGQYRVIAPNGMAGAYLSVVLAIGLISGVLISKYIGVLEFIVASLLILTSIIFVGRSGLFIFFILLPLIYLVKYVNKTTSIIVVLSHLLLWIIFAFSSLFLLYLSIDFLSSFHPAFVRLARMLVPMIEGGIFNDPTIMTLSEHHYFMPDNLNDFLFGIGTSGRNEIQTGIYIASDVGFVRLIFAIGIIGSLLLYGFYFIIFFNSMLKLRNSILMKFVFLASIFIFVFHLKEVGFGTLVLSLILFIPYFSYFYIKKSGAYEK